MASFLTRFAGKNEHGVPTSFGAGAAARARDAGYTPKQIAVAITQNKHGLNVGGQWSPGGDAHYAAATSLKGFGDAWLHNYQSPSGGIGMQDLERAMKDGYSPMELIKAGSSTLLARDRGWMPGITQSYFPEIMGFGEEASAYLSKFLKKKKKKNEYNYAAPQPMAPPPPPGSNYGGANLTAGYTARGLSSPQPANWDKTTGGLGEAFKRDKKRKLGVNPAMQINPITV